MTDYTYNENGSKVELRSAEELTALLNEKQVLLNQAEERQMVAVKSLDAAMSDPDADFLEADEKVWEASEAVKVARREYDELAHNLLVVKTYGNAEPLYSPRASSLKTTPPTSVSTVEVEVLWP